MSLPTAKVITDSISPDGIRLTTLQTKHHRFIHSEFMTHRALSRNASSSRAIPVAKMLDWVTEDPAMPIYWGSNKPGMQAGAELTDDDLVIVKHHWLRQRDLAVIHVRRMVELGLHKQIANRLLEPWSWINVVVTATDWANFFALRRHKDAQPEMKALADAMFEAMEESKPRPLLPGDWHLPYVEGPDMSAIDDHIGGVALFGKSEEKWLAAPRDTAIRISVARCARVSYLTHEGKPSTVEEDLALYDRLVGSHPMHASPAEHQAMPDVMYVDEVTTALKWRRPGWHGNLRGWIQYRKTLAGENITRA